MVNRLVSWSFIILGLLIWFASLTLKVERVDWVMMNMLVYWLCFCFHSVWLDHFRSSKMRSRCVSTLGGVLRSCWLEMNHVWLNHCGSFLMSWMCCLGGHIDACVISRLSSAYSMRANSFSFWFIFIFELKFLWDEFKLRGNFLKIKCLEIKLIQILSNIFVNFLSRAIHINLFLHCRNFMHDRVCRLFIILKNYRLLSNMLRLLRVRRINYRTLKSVWNLNFWSIFLIFLCICIVSQHLESF